MFIYVMDTESRDLLLKHGYKLLKENEQQTVWVFKNKDDQQFDSFDIPCVVSDVLTF